VVTRIWDCFLADGWKVIYRVQLALLKTHEKVGRGRGGREGGRERGREGGRERRREGEHNGMHGHGSF